MGSLKEIHIFFTSASVCRVHSLVHSFNYLCRFTRRQPLYWEWPACLMLDGQSGAKQHTRSRCLQAETTGKEQHSILGEHIIRLLASSRKGGCTLRKPPYVLPITPKTEDKQKLAVFSRWRRPQQKEHCVWKLCGRTSLGDLRNKDRQCDRTKVNLNIYQLVTVQAKGSKYISNRIFLDHKNRSTATLYYMDKP